MIYSKFYFVRPSTLPQFMHMNEIPNENLICIFVNNSLLDNFMRELFVEKGGSANDFFNAKTQITDSDLEEIQQQVFNSIPSYELNTVKNYLNDGCLCFYSSSHSITQYEDKYKYFVSYIADGGFGNAVIYSEEDAMSSEQIKKMEKTLSSQLHATAILLNIQKL